MTEQAIRYLEEKASIKEIENRYSRSFSILCILAACAVSLSFILGYNANKDQYCIDMMKGTVGMDLQVKK